MKPAIMMKTIMYSFLLLAPAGAGYAQIGFGTASPNSNLDVRGGLAINLRAFTTNTAIASTDYTLVFTGTAAATATLPDASTCAGRIYWIKNASATSPTPVLTIATTSSQTIDGIGSWDLDEPNEAVRVMSNGSNWHVGNQDVPVAKTATTAGSWMQGGNEVTAAKTFGAITGFDLAFTTNNVEQMRLTSAGYLGVGTANPLGSLHFVNDNVSNGNIYYFNDYMNGVNTVTAGLFMRKSRGTFASPANLQNGDLISQFRFAGRYNGALTRSGGSGIDAYYLGDGTTDSTDLRLFTSSVENMRINQRGNMAIGATSFSAAQERLLVDAGVTNSYNVISGKGSIDNYLQLNIQNRSSSGSASADIVATANNGDESNNYIDLGINSTGYNSALLPILSFNAQAYLFATGANFVIGNGASGYNLIFFTNGVATTNERMRITAAGDVGIGNIIPGDKLTVAGIISPGTDNSYTMGSSANRWSAVWATNGVIQTSDARLKTNMEPLEYGARDLLRLEPVTYRWKKTPLGRRSIGLIAQQTRKVIPEVVKGDEKKENLGMNYPELVVVLINTIKEQQQRLQSLKQQLAQLEKEAK